MNTDIKQYLNSQCITCLLTILLVLISSDAIISNESNENDCGKLREGYAEIIDVSTETIQNMKTTGFKVMATSKLHIHEVGCTRMLCDKNRNPCCNSCFGFPLLNDEIKLSSFDGDNDDSLSCSGDNCEMMCGQYKDGDIITIYGEINDLSVIVHEHCLSNEVKE